MAKQNLKCWSCFECWFRPASDLEDLGIGLRLFVAWQLIKRMRKRSKRALLLVALHENAEYLQVEAFSALGLLGVFVDVTHRSVLTRRWTECKISKEGFGKLVAGLPKDCSFLMIWWALLQYVTGRNTVDRIKYRTCISM